MTVCVRQLTAPGAGAVSVLLVSGAGSRELVSSFSTRELPEVGGVIWTRLRIHGEIIDEALVCAPSMDDVEVHLHGSPAVVSAIQSYLAACGACTSADPAIPPASVEERALALVHRAHGESGARILLDQAAGALRRALGELARSRSPSDAAAVLSERARVASFAFRPSRVVIAGPVNAGKSTLFNALVGARRATVSEAPGTTRDVVREAVWFGAYPVALADTAGERLTEGRDASAEIERAGQARAVRERVGADWVLWLAPIDAPDCTAPTAPNHERITVIRSCADRVSNDETSSHRGGRASRISARDDPSAARAIIHALFRREFALPLEPWTPGAAVPFEVEQQRVLDDLRSTGVGLTTDARLRALVDDRGSSSTQQVAT